MDDWFKNLSVPQAIVVCVGIIAVVLMLVDW